MICLDECHHLRSEWWAALEHFMHEMENAGVKVISLTATPPYDSTTVPVGTVYTALRTDR